MAATRRYAIASYDRLGLARVLATSPRLGILLMLALGAVLAGFMYTAHGPMAGDSLRLFEFIPASIIHNLGLAVIVIVFLAGLLGAANMVVQIGKTGGFPRGVRLNWLEALWEAIGIEVLGQRRYRRDCEATSAHQPWYLQKWFIHASTMWGFLGLLAATALDYALDLLGVKATGTWVPIWYPVRLLGTIAGLFLVYGTSMALLRRLRKRMRPPGIRPCRIGPSSRCCGWRVSAGLSWKSPYTCLSHRCGATGCCWLTWRWRWSWCCWPPSPSLLTLSIAR